MDSFVKDIVKDNPDVFGTKGIYTQWVPGMLADNVERADAVYPEHLAATLLMLASENDKDQEVPLNVGKRLRHVAFEIIYHYHVCPFDRP